MNKKTQIRAALDAGNTAEANEIAAAPFRKKKPRLRRGGRKNPRKTWKKKGGGGGGHKVTDKETFHYAMFNVKHLLELTYENVTDKNAHAPMTLSRDVQLKDIIKELSPDAYSKPDVGAGKLAAAKLPMVKKLISLDKKIRKEKDEAKRNVMIDSYATFWNTVIKVPAAYR